MMHPSPVQIPAKVCVLTLVLCVSWVAGDELERRDAPPVLSAEQALETFTLPAGYEVNLFASEADFPIANLVAMKWDRRGRLWAANIPGFPQVEPDGEYRDSIVILEDTDGDGRADKHTVFADKLYLPLGFAISDHGRGAYVSSQPHLLHLLDTDGDGRADQRHVVLHGFGSEDSHHAISAFRWAPDGSLYMAQGMFLFSNVETPWGPRRVHDAAVFRFRPSTHRLEVFGNYGWSNPWGIVFDRWGHPLLMDASPGENYYLPHLMQNFAYEQLPATETHPGQEHKIPELNFFQKGRPNCGAAFVSSRNFPDDVQYTYLNGQMVGFHGLRWAWVEQRGSGYHTTQARDLLTSTDPSFRPVDMAFGPDGALYVADFYNPVVGHMTYEFRDPRRDKTHGRIWRIRCKDKPLERYPDFVSEPTQRLLGLLTDPTLDVRSHALRELQERDAGEVLPAVEKWVSSLDASHTDYELSLLAALWVYQGHDALNLPLLERLLEASKPDARASAIRALRFEMYRIEDPMRYLRKRALDPHMRVRLEAVNALSDIASAESVRLVLEAARLPMDAGLYWAAKRALDYLSRVVPVDLAGTVFEARALTDAELAERLNGSYSREIGYEALRRVTLATGMQERVLDRLRNESGADRVSALLQAAQELQQRGATDIGGVSRMMAAMSVREATDARPAMLAYLDGDADGETSRDLRRAAYAGLLLDPTADARDAIRLAERRGEIALLADGAAMIRDAETQQRLQPVFARYLRDQPETDPQVMVALLSGSLHTGTQRGKSFAGLAELAADGPYRLRRAAVTVMNSLPAGDWPSGYEAFVVRKPADVAKVRLGSRIYMRDGMCGTCHQQDGRGVPGAFPPLVASPWIEGDPQRLIKVAQAGMMGPLEIDGEKYNAVMPPIGMLLSDKEMAAVLTYIRTSWHNIGTEITAEQVAKVRAEMAGRLTPWTVEEILALHPLP